jgi:hypothetical protein
MGPDYDDLARRLQVAMQGWGTDEQEVYSVLLTVGRDATRLQALREAYLTRTGRTLDADLRGDMGGVELALAHAFIGGTREQRVRRQLGRTAWGTWAKVMIDALGIPVNWEYTGTGSFHQGGEIFLNYRKPSKPAALTMVHEVQHAVSYRTGQHKDATATPKADWVASMIADEAEAETKSMEAALGMRAEGDTARALGKNASMLNQFKAAFDAEKARRLAAGEWSAIAYLGARQHVRDGLVTGWFSDGTFRTSTSGTTSLTYQQHYENEWDRLNSVGGS